MFFKGITVNGLASYFADPHAFYGKASVGSRFLNRVSRELANEPGSGFESEPFMALGAMYDSASLDRGLPDVQLVICTLNNGNTSSGDAATRCSIVGPVVQQVFDECYNLWMLSCTENQESTLLRRPVTEVYIVDLLGASIRYTSHDIDETSLVSYSLTVT